MWQRLNYYWRVLATGWSFFIFGAAGVLCWGLIYPLVAPFLGQGLVRTRRSRYLMYRMFRVYMGMMHRLGILNYRVEQGERLLAPGRLIIANHPCLLDIVFLISQTPNATCIVKPSLVRNPFMRIPIRAMGYIYADHPDNLMACCAEEMQAGSCLIVFPEGTRTTPGQAMKFQRGTAAIALHAQCPVLPVVLDCTPSTLTKDLEWYQIPPRRFTLTMRVGEELPVVPPFEDQARSLASRHLTRDWEQYFKQCLSIPPDAFT